jgi:LuxR family maltose regulon positive regulatory protein
MADKTANNIEIIRTKLHRPPVSDDHIHRQRLLDILDQHRQFPLILVAAPAGYGKSTLMSCWLQTCEYPSAWLSLDENDSDLRMFLIYFVRAVQKMFPDVGGNTLDLLKAPNLPPFSKLAASLVNELSAIEQTFVLALDDYQSIREQSVHDLLTELSRHPHPSMHLVFMSRRDPPLPFAKYRAQGRLIEIGARELCFTIQETETFLKQALRREVDHPDVITWHEKTEGWVTGLQLAALGMRHHVEEDRLPSSSLTDTQYVREYFYNEVFSSQPPEIQHYLLSTAILNRFNAPLCEAVSRSDDKQNQGDFNGWEFIAWLKRENLFLVPLDADNSWFRYHHLFQELLVNQLKRCHSARKIHGLHFRASDWFAEKGLIEEALQNALAAEDTKRAVDLIAQAGFQLMENQEWSRLQRWLNMLPYEAVEQSPELIILKAWIFQVQHNRLDMFACLEKIEALKVTSQPEILAKCDTIKGYYETLNAFRFYMAADIRRALTHSRIAIDNLSGQQQRPLVLAHIAALSSHQILGDMETGLHIYKEAMKDPAIKNSDYYSMFMAYLCFVYWMEADLFSYQQTAEAALLLVEKKNLPENAAFANYFMGIAHYCLNDLERAVETLSKVVHTDVIHNSMIFANSSFALALVYQAKGESDQARINCDAVTKHAIEISNDIVLGLAQAFTAELALRQGRLTEASQWAKQFRAKPFIPPYLFFMPQLTLAKILLAQDTIDSRQQAADLLDELHAFLVSIHNKVFLIHVLALQALLHDARGEVQAALEKLTEAIALAEPGGFIRLFADMGPRMAYLLKRLIRQNTALGYIGRILAAFRDEEAGLVQEVTDLQTVRLSSLDSQPFVDPLTRREIEVMELLMKRLSNKEIADKLLIKNETVKTHLTHIYQKLNVTNRRQAVEKSTALGIFSSR